MNEMEKLVEICNSYIDGKFSIEEFQKRIETVYLPDECKNTLEKVQHNAHNKLEEIRFCYGESKEDADEVAKHLVQAVIAEQERLKND